MMPAPFRSGHAAGGDWRRVAEACLAQLGQGAGNLGFLYVTDYWSAELPDIHRFLARETGVGHWVGAVGIGICATGVEYLDQPAMSVLIGDFPDGSFDVFREPDGGGGSELLQCGDAPASIAVVHSDPLAGDVAKRIVSLARRTETGFLVGGLTSSRRQNRMLANGVLDGGLSGVAFTDAVTVATRLSQGCSPIGPAHEVTGAQHNVVVTLDNRSALEVMRADLGVEANEELAQLGGQVFVGLSVAGSDTGDYVVRNLIGIDPSSKLIAVGDRVRKGQRLHFCRRDGETARADMARMLDSIKQGLYTAPRGALYFSCLGRGGALFGGESAELRMVQEALGDVPLTGFFCNGEISHHRLYSYTGVLTLFL